MENGEFYKRLFFDWYSEIAHHIPSMDGDVVEVGSGDGELKKVIPDCITSDIIEGNDRVFSAENMPFKNGSLKAILMINVLHHLRYTMTFYTEAIRCLKTGGRVIMIEPTNTLWSHFIYSCFHYEPFNVNGNLSNTISYPNNASTWITFRRDYECIFSREYPELKLLIYRNHTPLSYILSGGKRLNSRIPAFVYPIIRLMEKPFSFMGLFTTVVLEKIDK